MSQICLLLGRLTTSKRAMHRCCQFTEISAKLFLKKDLSVCQRKIRLFLYLKRSRNSRKLRLFFSVTFKRLKLYFFLPNLGLFFVIFPFNKKKNIQYVRPTLSDLQYILHSYSAFDSGAPFFILAEKSSWVPATRRATTPVPFRHYNQTPGFVLEQLYSHAWASWQALCLTDKRALDYLNECKAVSGPDWGAIYLNQVQRWILCEL